MSLMRVTIGLPVTSDAAYVRDAVRSIFAQSIQDWELIIVADGADAEVVDTIGRLTDPRVKIVLHKERAGLPARLNEIARSARAPLLVRMDGDDVMHPERLERQLAAWERDEPDVLGSASYLIDTARRVRGSYREPELPRTPAGYLRSGVFSHPTVIMRTAWARENLYDPSRIRTEDKELWLRTAQSSKHAKLAERLLFCRVPARLSISKQALTARQDRKLLREQGHLVAGHAQVTKAIATSFVKQVAFATLSATGLQSVAYRSKAHALPEDVLRGAQETLDRVVRTPVPGWSDDER